MAREKKEDRKRNPEALGIAGFTIGIVSLVLALFSPVLAILSSLVGIFLSLKQQRKQKTRAAKIGLILSIIALILSVVMWWVLAQFIYPYLQQQVGSGIA